MLSCLMLDFHWKASYHHCILELKMLCFTGCNKGCWDTFSNICYSLLHLTQKINTWMNFGRFDQCLINNPLLWHIISCCFCCNASTFQGHRVWHLFLFAQNFSGIVAECTYSVHLLTFLTLLEQEGEQEPFCCNDSWRKSNSWRD